MYGIYLGKYRVNTHQVNTQLLSKYPVLSKYRSFYQRVKVKKFLLSGLGFYVSLVLRYAACRQAVSYGRRKRVFLGKKLLSVCGGYMPGESLSSSFQRCQWKANIPQACKPVMTFQDL